MKKTLILILALAFTFPLIAQKSKGKEAPASPTPTANTEKANPRAADLRAMYDRAVNYNDMAVATQCIYELILLEPGNVGLMDTLSQLYFQRQAWPNVVLVTMDLLKEQPDHAGALELQAIAYQGIGRPKEALDDYEKLYKITRDPYHLYEIAALQFTLKRFGECEANTNVLIKDPSLIEKKIVISLQDGSSQDVPLNAAAMNLHGVLDLEQGKDASAKEYFEAAVKTFPDFMLAKMNLEAMQRKP